MTITLSDSDAPKSHKTSLGGWQCVAMSSLWKKGIRRGIKGLRVQTVGSASHGGRKELGGKTTSTVPEDIP